jgi:hypothetical protein
VYCSIYLVNDLVHLFSFKNKYFELKYCHDLKKLIECDITLNFVMVVEMKHETMSAILVILSYLTSFFAFGIHEGIIEKIKLLIIIFL